MFVTLLLSACGGPDQLIKKGNEASAIGEWYSAANYYGKAYAKIPATEKDKRGALAFKVGESNRKYNYVVKALMGYRNAARYNFTDTTTFFQLAEMERMSRDYKQANKDYETYLEQVPGDKLTLNGIRSCAVAPEMKNQGSAYTVKEDKVFNSRYDDYCPCLVDGQFFVSSTRHESNGDDISGITGMKNGDIFFAAKDEKGKWKKLEGLPESVNTQYDEGACCFSPDGKTMYFTRCRWDANYPRFAEIYSSTRSDATWSAAQQCVLSHDTLSVYAHPAVSPDGQFLYFVSDMPGGQGGLDIWRSEITANGFGMIENLGPEVNSPGNEMFPTFRPNGDLYFSSNGRVGMGGLDIYCAKLDTAQKRWNVTALPSPVNSNGDDFGMTFDGIHNRGYFCSNRANRRGWDKVYSFECPEVIQSVKGWVYEQDGYELPKAQVYMVGDDGRNEKLSVKLDGSFEVEVKPNVNYLFLAVCEGYMNYTNSYRTVPVTESREDTLQFPLPSSKIPVLVHNVFYDFNKATITPSSIPALNGLVNLLKQNPSIAIELSAHCDYRGSQEYNLKLSQHRADAVVNYLTSHGIDKRRVLAKGYGKAKPKVITGKFAEWYPFLKKGEVLSEEFIKKLSKSKQDTCNALNRRTEFTVEKTTFGLLDKQGKLRSDKLSSSTPKNAAKPAAEESSAKEADAVKKPAAVTKTVGASKMPVTKTDTTKKASSPVPTKVTTKSDSVLKVKRAAVLKKIAEKKAVQQSKNEAQQAESVQSAL